MLELTTLNGTVVPAVGIGTYPLQDKEVASVVKHAISIGYRLIDTSDDYRNEDGIGIGCANAIREGMVKREDLFLQTKLSDNNSYSLEPLANNYFSLNSMFMKRHSVEEIVREKVETSLRNLRTDYLDSLLIHLPYVGFYEEIWEVMIKLHHEGIVRYIGVSNFRERHIDVVVKSGFIPQINQIYFSPISTKESIVDYCKINKIRLMTYSPLIDIRLGKIVNNSVFEPIMSRCKKSLAQIVLRWNVERGSMPLPKSSNPKRLAENFNILDFELTSEEIKIISSLNYDYQHLAESKICPGL